MKNKKLLVLLSATLIALTGCNNGGGTSSSAAGTSSSITPTSVPTSSSSSTEAINYGSLEKPLTISEAKALCDKLEENKVSDHVIFVTGYVKSIKKNSSDYTIWISTTADGENEFELYGAVIDEDVVTPVVGSKVIATGYYEKYVGKSSTTYELTFTTIDGTKVNPKVVYSDAVAPTVNVIGTIDAPKTVTEALEAIAALNGTSSSKNYSPDKYYVKAVVTEFTSDNNVYTMTVADTTDLSKTLNVYQATLGENITGPSVGDEVVILGHLANYYGKNQMSGNTDDNYVAPVIAKTTANTSTYEVTYSIVDDEGAESTNATVTGLPTQAVSIGTDITFTVTATSGFKVTSVKFNGDPLTAETDGTYKVVSYLVNVIEVVVVEDIAYADTTVEYSIETIATDNSWIDGNVKGAPQYTTLPTGKEELSITATGGSNTGKYYNNGKDWRFYQNESASLNISVSGSHVIKSVTLTYTTSKNGIATYNGAQYASDKEITIASQSLVTIGVGNTSTTTNNGQVRITKIKVIYA